MIRIVLFLLLLASPSFGQAVRVTSGEHEGFTRVVLEFPDPVDWQVGRADGGYEMQVAGGPHPYDLSRAFDLIGRTRLGSLMVDPENGSLRLGVACACHALPFALRPDVVVIDIRDGAAPEGWSFETALDGRAMPPLGESHAGTGPAVVSAAPWDWRDIALGGRWASVAPATTLPVAPDTAKPEVQFDANARLSGLDVMLTEGFSRAATMGLIEPVDKPPRPDPNAVRDMDMAQVRLGAGVDVRPALDAAPDLAAQGQQCPGEERLALQDWGDDRPIHEQMADATTSLSGEFDQTQPDALYRAVRFQLFLGFGAEARGLLRAFGGAPPDAPLWTSLSLLVDGETDPDGPLRGLAACDDPAALWATIADSELPLSGVNTKALLRSFSALPPHLRLQTGPALAERFLVAGDPTGAQALSDAILRPAGSDDDRRATLMQVRLAIEAGDTASADRLLAPLVADPGPLAMQVIVSQIDLAALTGAPVTQAVVTSVEAVLREADLDSAPVLKRALVLAHALSGDFAAAFAALADSPEAEPDFWRLLARMGSDDAVLEHAMKPPEQSVNVPVETRRKLAERLLALGFPDAVKAWVAGDDPLLSAQAALLLGRPADVLTLLGAADGDAARRLKADALLQFDAGAAMPAFAALGDDAAAARAARLAQAWPALAAGTDEPWRQVAQALEQASTPSAALARSRALAESAVATEQAVGALLGAVPAPDP